MRLTILFENLDDKDEFGLDCAYIGCDRRPDRDEFHAAHEAARDAAMNATTIFPYQTYDGLDRGYKKAHKGNRQYWNNFVAAMAKQGYKLSSGEFIKESLDDKDEFTKDPGCGGGCPLSDHPNDWYKQFNRDESFHDAHESAHEAAIRAMGSGDRNEQWSRYATTAIDKMREFGYQLANPLESDLRKAPLENWLFTKLSIKESLDDKDEFVTCDLCVLGPPTATLDEITDFHNAHLAADQEWGSGPDWYRTLERYGYKLNAMGWEPITEDLDDKDKFYGELIATGKVKTHHSFAGTEWELELDGQNTTQGRIIYAMPRETFGSFPKYITINNVKFDAEVIMNMDGKVGFYDDGDIRELEE